MSTGSNHLHSENASDGAGRRNFLWRLGLLGVAGLAGNLPSTAVAMTGIPEERRKRKLKPVLDGDWWLIGRTPKDVSPPSGEALKKLVEDRRRLNNRQGSEYDDYGEMLAANLTKVEPVDHHIFKGEDGFWHLWGCIRNTDVGRLLYHWKAKRLEDSPWEETGEIIRCDVNAGECIDDWYGQEWMQSPYFVNVKGKYYMFYGGHSTGKDKFGNRIPGDPPSVNMRKAESQICLMTSDDGIQWERHKDNNGFSRVFVGPGQSRDPCLIKIKGTWHMYYSGDEQNHLVGGVFVRTSKDLVNWSDYKLVYHDDSFGGTTWQHECPHVVYRNGYYYLFVTENYAKAKSHVYRSEDPLNFGTTTEKAQELYVGGIACAAPEIYESDGKEYVSSNHNPPLGTQMCRLKWIAV